VNHGYKRRIIDPDSDTFFMNEMDESGRGYRISQVCSFEGKWLDFNSVRVKKVSRDSVEVAVLVMSPCTYYILLTGGGCTGAHSI